MFEIYGNLCLLLSSFGLHKVKGEKKRKVRVDGQKTFRNTCPFDSRPADISLRKPRHCGQEPVSQRYY